MSRIKHTVVVKLKHASGSPEEQTFLEAAKELAQIPGVESHEILKQAGDKTPYALGFSMEFADQSVYDAYSVHPDHVAFVSTWWAANVDEFLELDYSVR